MEKQAPHESLGALYQGITELPFVASTTGDSLFAVLVPSRRTRERYRERARELLDVHLPEALSFGRAGRINLEPSYVLPVAVAIRVAATCAQRLHSDLLRYGVSSSEPGNLDASALTHVVDLLQQQHGLPGYKASLAARVNRELARLTLEDNVLRDLALRKRRRWADLSRQEALFTRLPGELVRVEDGEALLTVYNEKHDREELRSVNAAQLSDVGTDSTGDPLVLYEMEYAPGMRFSSVMPGVRADEDAEAETREEAALRARETPLPSLAELEERERELTAHNSQSAAGPDRPRRG